MLIVFLTQEMVSLYCYAAVDVTKVNTMEVIKTTGIN
jgi:hypothetical protein